MPSKNPPRLAADETLGKLALWLRVLGLDTVYLRPGTGPAQKSRLARGRIFLTRTKGLALGRTIFVAQDEPREQLRAVVAELGLEEARLNPFSRCLRCNQILEKIARDQAAGLVPDHILRVHHSFKRCPECGRVYWPGSHQERMSRRLKQLEIP